MAACLFKYTAFLYTHTVVFRISPGMFGMLTAPPVEGGSVTRERATARKSTANLPTNIVDFRGLDSSKILILRGGILRPDRELPGKFESSNLGRDNVSREFWRTGFDAAAMLLQEAWPMRPTRHEQWM